MSMTADLIADGKFSRSNTLTNLLYALGKSQYKHIDNKYLTVALDQILQEPKIDIYLCSRNLWNLYALDFKHEEALQKFSECIIAADGDKLNEVDIANALRAFAHF